MIITEQQDLVLDKGNIINVNVFSFPHGAEWFFFISSKIWNLRCVWNSYDVTKNISSAKNQTNNFDKVMIFINIWFIYKVMS